jgi:hypothetical protein
MSIKAMSWIWEHSEQKGGNLLMLLAIADRCDDFGICYPGIKRLAEKARITKPAASKALKRLEKQGELSIKVHGGVKTTHGHTNRYYLKKYRDSLGLTTPDGNRDEYKTYDGVSHRIPQEVSAMIPQEVSPVIPYTSGDTSVDTTDYAASVPSQQARPAQATDSANDCYCGMGRDGSLFFCRNCFERMEKTVIVAENICSDCESIIAVGETCMSVDNDYCCYDCYGKLKTLYGQAQAADGDSGSSISFGSCTNCDATNVSLADGKCATCLMAVADETPQPHTCKNCSNPDNTVPTGAKLCNGCYTGMDRVTYADDDKEFGTCQLCRGGTTGSYMYCLACIESEHKARETDESITPGNKLDAQRNKAVVRENRTTDVIDLQARSNVAVANTIFVPTPPGEQSTPKNPFGKPKTIARQGEIHPKTLAQLEDNKPVVAATYEHEVIKTLDDWQLKKVADCFINSKAHCGSRKNGYLKAPKTGKLYNNHWAGMGELTQKCILESNGNSKVTGKPSSYKLTEVGLQLCQRPDERFRAIIDERLSEHKKPGGKKKSAKKEVHPLYHEMHAAIIEAFGHDTKTMDKSDFSRVGGVAKNLLERGAKPFMIRKYHGWCKNKFDYFGYDTLKKWYPTWRAEMGDRVPDELPPKEPTEEIPPPIAVSLEDFDPQAAAEHCRRLTAELAEKMCVSSQIEKEERERNENS